MTILKVLNDVKLNGNLIHAGEYVRTNNPGLFLQQGYARRLYPEEARAILAEYVERAQDLFSGKPRETPERTVPAKIDEAVVFQGRLF